MKKVQTVYSASAEGKSIKKSADLFIVHQQKVRV